MQEFVDNLYTTHVPLVLRDLATCHPNFVRTEKMIEFDNKGLGRVILYTSEPHLSLEPIYLSDQEFSKLQRLKNEFKALREDRVSYIRAVSKCLVTLKTTSVVKREFPEALKYLEESPDTKEEGPYSELRKKLQQANC